MPKIHVSRSIDVKCNIEDAIAVLADFNQWQSWSPWLITDPEAKVTVAQEGKYFEWLGDRVGQGNMLITYQTQDRVDYALSFIKPFKSKANVQFLLTPSEDGHVSLEWAMDSSLPFFMFFMKKSMETYIGADYGRGLTMLKAVLESGQNPSHLAFLGSKTGEKRELVGIRTTCSTDDVGDAMKRDFENIEAWLTSTDTDLIGPAVSIYHKFDLPNKIVEYTAAVQVNLPETEVPSHFTTEVIEAGELEVIEHTGPYEFLGNAWSAGMIMQRAKEFEPKKDAPPFEIYKNAPGDTAPNDLLTEVCFPRA